VHATERMLKAVGDRTRLRILALLQQGPLCVCQLVEILGLSQPTVSKHLSTLGAAGLVEDEKRGKWVFYRLPAAPASAAAREAPSENDAREKPTAHLCLLDWHPEGCQGPGGPGAEASRSLGPGPTAPRCR